MAVYLVANTKWVINLSPISDGPLAGKQLVLFAISVGSVKELQAPEESTFAQGF